ncbi:minor capsid protein [Salimicrobium halophilum]|uniref:Phage putative head morphogenesis protein, SPP1 gp7 family n=1 Tax=Salimicrobium halophilum TaxID=86666 RepID=A0A1G8WDS7_9BACI|nr:minor capsid protein [Salimicrobium halophilum]SDJ76381.1 phage putative head morphogenesis protein, SPP1 gp7 family [Salimicrobium halophilum]
MTMTLSDEIKRLRRRQERMAGRDLSPLLEAYRKSLKIIQAEITNIVENNTDDEGKLSFTKQERFNTLRQMEKQIAEQAEKLGRIEVEESTDILKKRYEDMYYRTAYTLDRGMEQIVSFSLLRPEMIEAAVYTPIAGEMFSDRVWKNKDKMTARLRDILERNMLTGKDPTKLARELKKEFGTSAFESTRLVQNEVARVTRQAADRIYEQSDVVEELMFDATLDNKTSEICQGLDGNRYPVGGDKPEIPDDTHVSCRSDYIPVVAGWEPSRKYDNEAKKEIDYTSVRTWRESRGLAS